MFYWERFMILGIVSWGFGCGMVGFFLVYIYVFEFVIFGWLKINGDIWGIWYFILDMILILYVVYFKMRWIFVEIKCRVYVVYVKYYLV